MTPVPAKVLTVAKQSSQYRVLVQIELEKYLGSFRTLRFGERKPFTGSCYHCQLDLFTTEIPALKPVSRSVVPALDDYVTLVTRGGPDGSGGNTTRGIGSGSKSDSDF